MMLNCLRTTHTATINKDDICLVCGKYKYISNRVCGVEILMELDGNRDKNDFVINFRLLTK